MKNNIKIPSALKKVLADNNSGSSELLSKLNSFFLKDPGSFPIPLKYIPHLKKELTPFQGIAAYLDKLKKIKDKDSYIKFLTSWNLLEELAYLRIDSKLFPLIKNHSRILTFSNSKTVYKVLSQFKRENKKLTVIIAESRPVNEGRIMAKLLAKQKIKVEFITEAMLPEFIEICDCVILGADRILKNGDVVNKTGSSLIAILCKEFNKPLYVVCNKTKQSVKNAFIKENKPAKEIWGTKDPLIHVNNFYFERVEKKYLTKVITD
ncbi:MAG: hypothetical protein C0412_11235 [Flavobacterium sp.]|nr:hypothetical protein [Flavobacterium sp.]